MPASSAVFAKLFGIPNFGNVAIVEVRWPCSDLIANATRSSCDDEGRACVTRQLD